MGVGVDCLIQEELYWEGARKVAVVGRAYLTQSVALVSICRRIVPLAAYGDAQQQQRLRCAIESMNSAFDGARNVRKTNRQDLNTAYAECSRAFFQYLTDYHGSDTEVVPGILKALQDMISDPDEERGVENPPSTGKRSPTAAASTSPVTSSKGANPNVKSIEDAVYRLQKHDRMAAEHLNRLEESLGIKLKNLFSKRKTTLEIWIWHEIPLAAGSPTELQKNVCRPHLIFEEELNPDYILSRLLDRHHAPDPKDRQSSAHHCPYGSINLLHNPHFYHIFPSRRRDFDSGSTIDPLNGVFNAQRLKGEGSPYTPSMLHLVFDRETSIFVDIKMLESRIFGNLWRTLDSAIVLKDKRGTLELADDWEARSQQEKGGEQDHSNLTIWSHPYALNKYTDPDKHAKGDSHPTSYNFVVSSKPRSVLTPRYPGNLVPADSTPPTAPSRTGTLRSVRTMSSDATLRPDIPSNSGSTSTLVNPKQPAPRLTPRSFKPTPPPIPTTSQSPKETKLEASPVSPHSRGNLNAASRTIPQNAKFVPEADDAPLASGYVLKRENKPAEKPSLFRKLFRWG